MTTTKLTLREKLLNIQLELKAPKSQRNTFGNYNYRSCEDILEALKPLLGKYKVVLTIGDQMVKLGDRYYVKTQVEIKDVDGDNTMFVNAYAREEETKKGMDGSQITGAASSYARKYALNGLFGIDDTKDSDTTNKHDEKAVPQTKEDKAFDETLDSMGDDLKEEGPSIKCPVCGGTITDKESSFSKSKYGKEMCIACQRDSEAK